MFTTFDDSSVSSYRNMTLSLLLSTHLKKLKSLTPADMTDDASVENDLVWSS